MFLNIFLLCGWKLKRLADKGSIDKVPPFIIRCCIIQYNCCMAHLISCTLMYSTWNNSRKCHVLGETETKEAHILVRYQHRCTQPSSNQEGLPQIPEWLVQLGAGQGQVFMACWSPEFWKHHSRSFSNENMPTWHHRLLSESHLPYGQWLKFT